MDFTAIAKKVLAAARSVPGVAGADPTRIASVATYGPGERVPHVAVRPTATGFEVEIHLSVRHDTEYSLPELAQQVREIIRRELEALGASAETIDVAFDDVQIEGEVRA